MEDITGQTFGELTAIKMTGIKSGKNLQWYCKCSCGKEIKAFERELLRGIKVNCGVTHHRPGMPAVRPGK